MKMTDEEYLKLLTETSIKEVWDNIQDGSLKSRFGKDLQIFMDEMLEKRLSEDKEFLQKERETIIQDKLQWMIDRTAWEKKEKELRGIIDLLKESSQYE